ncbi:hypothetical protein BN2364_3123 [Alloalcanivorax xenomutans]|nr:hypothetical protein BN2364_3123 [Alloalcanivorax xenomutans]
MIRLVDLPLPRAIQPGEEKPKPQGRSLIRFPVSPVRQMIYSHRQVSGPL